MGSRKGGTPKGTGAGPAGDRARWGGLNARQRAYLEAVYRADQAAEARERSAFSRGWERTPADVWRWIPCNDVRSPLYHALLRQKLVDPGTGSTFAALTRRGLLLTVIRPDRTPLGPVDFLFVRMTTAGRRAARAGLGEAAPEKLPPGTLREWHWRALARVYAAGEEGLAKEGFGDYGRIGWRTWLRLIDYQSKKAGYGGLVEERPVAPYKTGSEFSDWYRHRVFLTPDGRRFYRERWEEYRERYPDVDAPAPGEYQAEP